MGLLPPETAAIAAAGVPGGPELFVFLLLLVVPLAFVAAVVLGVRYLVTDHGGSDRDPALTELRLALARGEISEEEFERRRELLAESDPRSADRE